MLIFPLKKEWYEKIKSGEKTIEYREVKPYWTKRFWHEGGSLTFNTISYDYEATKDVFPFPMICKLQLGYNPKTRLNATITKIEVVDGKDTDLHIDRPVYAIHLSNIRERKKMTEEWKEMKVEEIRTDSTETLKNAKKMTKDELIKNQFPNDEFLQSAVSQIVDKCTADLEQKLGIERSSRIALVNKIAELEEKISVLLSCENCPENKDGLICRKEYENKCLAQKIQYIKELKEENAELKEKLKPENCLKLLAKEGYIKFTSDQLTKAKEIIEELYNIIPASMADYAKEPMEHARKFMTEE